MQFAKKAFVEQLNTELDITPWESTRPRGRADEYVLGLLLRNADGSLPAATVQTASAYQVVADDDTECGYWPTLAVSPVQEVNAFEWDDQLMPLVIKVPRGTNSLTRLEGFILRTPGGRGSALFPADEFGDSAAFAKDLLILPFTIERVVDGFGCKFVVLRPRQAAGRTPNREQTTASGTALEKLAAMKGGVSINYRCILPDGSSKRANMMRQVELTPDQGNQLVDQVKKVLPGFIAAGELPADAVAFVTNGNVAVELHQVGFMKTPEMSGVEVDFQVATGGPIPERFVLENIPLQFAGDEQAVNEFISQLNIEAAPEPVAEMRTWSDATGRFTVEAKLVAADENSVRLEKSDGSQITVPRARLGSADLEYLDTRK